jgi:triphosphoribosyl-dephospho-CoA synthase
VATTDLPVIEAIETEPNTRAAQVQRAFLDACVLDVLSLKPGNVGAHGAGHGMQAADFLRSARVAAPAIAAEATTVGERIHAAIAATRAAVGVNTNLGIVLLVAPLAQAALRVRGPLTKAELGASLAQVLGALTVVDAQLAFEAIRLANPGGLGEAVRHDVRAPARVGLLEAMREAANRDSIARQYVSGFADVLGTGLERLAAARAAGRDRRWAATEVFLDFLCRYPDSHVARKFGPAEAEALRREACVQAEVVRRSGDTRVMRGQLQAWDAALKARTLNPGTSADLTVATLFASRLLAADW